jgi:prolipoprotein diacylglyceryl transferase
VSRLASIPSPTQAVWYLGPVPVRAYAICILIGILVAIRLGERRWMQRGGRPGVILDIAVWAVPFGIIGGRLYHVATTWQPYFGAGGDPMRAFAIWEGGLGIWGAVALGALGAWIGARRAGVLLPPVADALAPGIVLAQAIGRWGNWFNNELFGRATDLPWGLKVYEWDQNAGHAVLDASGKPKVDGIYHPTFLYESLWDLGTAGVLIWADRRFKLGHGRVFALYVLLYTLGRGWIEALRIDRANTVFGLRLNLWTSLIVGVGALVLFLLSARLRPGRETSVRRPEAATPDDGSAATVDPVPADPEPAADEVSEAEPPKPAPAKAEPAPDDKAEPAAKQAAPAPKKAEPAAADKPEPAAKKAEPAAKKAEPEAKKAEPAAADKPAPTAKKSESPAKKAAPVAKKVEPVAKEAEPVAKAEPAAHKADPVAKTVAPAAKKAEPVAKAEPAVKAEPAAEEAEAAEVVSSEPVDATSPEEHSDDAADDDATPVKASER